jgi:hypothetical protein
VFAATIGLHDIVPVQTNYDPAQQECGNLFLQRVSLPVRQLDTEPGPRRLLGMTTFANALALFGMALIRFGGRGGGGFLFMLFGLLIVGVLVWALTRPGSGESAKN